MLVICDSNHWINSRNGDKYVCSQPGIVACAVIPLLGGWTLRMDFEDGWFIKSSFLTKDEHEACQLTRTIVQLKNTNARLFSNFFDFEFFKNFFSVQLHLRVSRDHCQLRGGSLRLAINKEIRNLWKTQESEKTKKTQKYEKFVRYGDRSCRMRLHAPSLLVLIKLIFRISCKFLNLV